MTVFLAEPFKTLWADRDPFTEVEALPGEVFRALEGRRTLRTEVLGQGYFVKIHRGIGWGEILKNLGLLKKPVLGAAQEWQAIQALQQAGVATMTAVAFGQRGRNPATRHSFIVTEELAPTLSLEDVCRDWPQQPPEFAFKQALIGRVAQMLRGMHGAGVNHRDCYLVHFLLHVEPQPTAAEFRLSVIDLHRAQIRERVPTRWRNKDLAALYFSALNIGLTRRDKLRFLQIYFDRPLRDILASEAVLLRWLERRADKLLDRYQRRFAPGAGA
ncbi:MAG: lipopolysaccharide core heptose(I) kinase RfaP [Pseudomonas sp.]